MQERLSIKLQRTYRKGVRIRRKFPAHQSKLYRSMSDCHQWNVEIGYWYWCLEALHCTSTQSGCNLTALSLHQITSRQPNLHQTSTVSAQQASGEFPCWWNMATSSTHGMASAEQLLIESKWVGWGHVTRQPTPQTAQHAIVLGNHVQLSVARHALSKYAKEHRGHGENLQKLHGQLLLGKCSLVLFS